jgi:transcriptional regulator with XRE-family HTH domain
METFYSILEEIIQKNEENIHTVGEFANKINVSAAQLSRIKKGKSSLSDETIDKICNFFEKDKEYSDSLRFRLKKIQENTYSETLKTKLEQVKNKSVSEISVDNYSNLLRRLSQKESLLMVDNRDFPVFLEGAKHLDKLTINAVKEGLSIAMFQPFGSRLNLIERRNVLEIESLKIEQPLKKRIEEIVRAYNYLIELANKVTDLYLSFRNSINKCIDEGVPILGQVVLYEGEYKSFKEIKKGSFKYTKGALPSMVASGISSKLFCAHFRDSVSFQTKIYEWVTTQEDELLFVERSNTTLEFDAVKTQFNPVFAYWKEEKRLPDDDEQIEKAYEEFGLKKLLGEEETISWRPFQLPPS